VDHACIRSKRRLREVGLVVTALDLALVADIGGTNVRFALARGGAGELLVPGSIAQFTVAGFGSVVEAAREYLRGLGETPQHAVLAAAGPVAAGAVRITNNPWVIDAAQVRAALQLDAVRIVNDFAAMSAAIAQLRGESLRVIGAPPPPRIDYATPRVLGVIGPGTGLGVGVLVVRDGRALVLETEGGHVSFAPTTEEQAAVQRLLAPRLGHVSNERLVSGAGLLNIYQALCTLRGRPAGAASPEAVSAAAAAGQDPQAVRAAEMFAEILGAVAGDLVLTTGAWDGLYLAGGLVPPMLRWLERGGFRAHFENKGRFAAAVARVPTSAVMHEHAGLVGAAALALDARLDTVRPSSGGT
jgi:glucokinase